MTEKEILKRAKEYVAVDFMGYKSYEEVLDMAKRTKGLQKILDEIDSKATVIKDYHIKCLGK